MMDEEPVTQVVNSTEQGSVVVFFRENEVDVDEIGAYSVDRTEPHLRQECNSCLDRVQLERSDFTILRDEEPEKTDGSFAFATQGIFDGEIAARV